MKNDPNKDPICLLRTALETFDKCKKEHDEDAERLGKPELSQTLAVKNAPRTRVALIRACEELRVLTYGGVNAHLRQVEIGVLETHVAWAAEMAKVHAAPILPDSDEFYDTMMATDLGIQLMAQCTSTDSARAMVKGSWDGMIDYDDWEIIKDVVTPAVK